MADKKISQLTASTVPLVGTEVLPVVQSGATKQVSVANLTVGRAVSVGSLASTGGVRIGGYLAAGAFGYYLNAGNSGTVNYIQSFNDTTLNKLSLDCDSLDVRVAGFSTGLSLDSVGNLAIAGNLVIGTSGKGIDFSADGQAAGMTSELLDDYEEGTWTPALVIGSGSLTYTTQTGTYTKVGRKVTISGNIVINTVSSPDSFVVINSLPFVPSGADRGAGAVYAANMATGCPQIQLQIRGSAGDIYFQTFSSGATGNLGAFFQAASVLAFTATYEV